MKISNKVKDINTKNRTNYFFNDIIHIESFDPNNMKIDEKPHKNILVCYIGYVTIKEYLNIYSVNPLYLVSRYLNGRNYFEEINGNKYLTFVPTNKSKEEIIKFEEVWIKIRDSVRSKTKTSENYYEKYMKIKLNSDEKLSLTKTVEIRIIAKVVRASFLENSK